MLSGLLKVSGMLILKIVYGKYYNQKVQSSESGKMAAMILLSLMNVIWILSLVFWIEEGSSIKGAFINISIVIAYPISIAIWAILFRRNQKWTSSYDTNVNKSSDMQLNPQSVQNQSNETSYSIAKEEDSNLSLVDKTASVSKEIVEINAGRDKLGICLKDEKQRQDNSIKSLQEKTDILNYAYNLYKSDNEADSWTLDVLIKSKDLEYAYYREKDAHLRLYNAELRLDYDSGYLEFLGYLGGKYNQAGLYHEDAENKFEPNSNVNNVTPNNTTNNTGYLGENNSKPIFSQENSGYVSDDLRLLKEKKQKRKKASIIRIVICATLATIVLGIWVWQIIRKNINSDQQEEIIQDYQLYALAQKAYHDRDYETAHKYFNDLDGYARSKDYLKIILARRLLQDHSLPDYDDNMRSLAVDLKGLVDMEDVKEIIQSDEYFFASYLEGTWLDSNNTPQFKIIKETNENVTNLNYRLSASWNLPSLAVSGYLYLDGQKYIMVNDGIVTPVFEFTILEKDKLMVYSYSSDQYYTLHR